MEVTDAILRGRPYGRANDHGTLPVASRVCWNKKDKDLLGVMGRLVIAVAVCTALASIARSQKPVLTRSYDNARTGANLSETTFTGSRKVSPQQEREKTVGPSARQEAHNKLKCPVCGAAPSARVEEATYDAAVRLWETLEAQRGIIASQDKIIGGQKAFVPTIPDWQSLCRDAAAELKEAERKLTALQSKYDLEKKWFEIAPVEYGKAEGWLVKVEKPVSPKKTHPT